MCQNKLSWMFLQTTTFDWNLQYRRHHVDSKAISVISLLIVESQWRKDSIVENSIHFEPRWSSTCARKLWQKFSHLFQTSLRVAATRRWREVDFGIFTTKFILFEWRTKLSTREWVLKWMCSSSIQTKTKQVNIRLIFVMQKFQFEMFKSSRPRNSSLENEHRTYKLLTHFAFVIIALAWANCFTMKSITANVVSVLIGVYLQASSVTSTTSADFLIRFRPIRQSAIKHHTITAIRGCVSGNAMNCKIENTHLSESLSSNLN